MSESEKKYNLLSLSPSVETPRPHVDNRSSTKIHRLQSEVSRLTTELAEARAENERLTKKCQSSLANNLCPDHRDKQAGKPCLACEIERLTKKEAELRLFIASHVEENEGYVSVIKNYLATGDDKDLRMSVGMSSPSQPEQVEK